MTTKVLLVVAAFIAGFAVNSIISNSKVSQTYQDEYATQRSAFDSVPACPPGYVLTYSEIGFAPGHYATYCSKV